jgi:hypothetical protein
VGTGNATVSKETVGKIFRDALKGVDEVEFKPPSREIMYGD